MLVNAYIFYRKINIDSGVHPSRLLSHHGFQKAIAFAWINPQIHWASPGPMTKNIRKRSTNSGDSSHSPKRMRSSPGNDSSKKGDAGRRVMFDDRTLTEDGVLGIRLSRAFTHFPTECTSRTRCGIHGWCGFEKFQSVVRCQDCHAALCIGCYQLFHMTTDLPSEKSKLLQTILRHERSLKGYSSNKKKAPSTH
jgi:hypothetical protein